MKQASLVLVGTHDFKCFLASGSSVKDTVRTIYSISVIKKGKDIDIKVSGSGFLYNMVRIIVGTLLGVSDGRISLEDIKLALENGDRKKVGKTMPPQGLCLYSVSYTNKVQ
jgi:tRNA pseudouridine38-40 synthase